MIKYTSYKDLAQQLYLCRCVCQKTAVKLHVSPKLTSSSLRFFNHNLRNTYMHLLSFICVQSNPQGVFSVM